MITYYVNSSKNAAHSKGIAMHMIDLTKCGSVVVVNNADHTLKHYKTNASLRTIKQWATALDARAWVYSHTGDEGDVYVGIGAGTAIGNGGHNA